MPKVNQRLIKTYQCINFTETHRHNFVITHNHRDLERHHHTSTLNKVRKIVREHKLMNIQRLLVLKVTLSM